MYAVNDKSVNKLWNLILQCDKTDRKTETQMESFGRKNEPWNELPGWVNYPKCKNQ